jgi:hypothetical protein
MSIDPGIATKLPGNKSINLFPTPDINSDEFEYDSLVFNITPRVPPPELSSDEFPVKSTDLLLADTLKIFGPLQSRTIFRTTKVLQSNNELSRQMLSHIKVWDGQYNGALSPTSDYSCYLVASGLRDRYDISCRKLIRNQFVENDYFGVIAYEIDQKRTLIAFDKNWILPAIAKYIEDEITYEIERPASLRERIATYNPMSLDPENPIVRWDQIPNLHGELFSINDITIYPFHDSAFTTTDGYSSEVYMIFAPVNRDEAEKIFLYLYRNVQLYTNMIQLTVRDMPIELAKDFQYLFPIDLTFLGNYVIISTDQMTRDRLEHVYKFDELSFEFLRLNDLTGAYATYLLAESMYFQYTLRWERNILFIGLCGYIQVLDIIEHFGQILNEIERQTPYYKELPNFSSAANLVANSDSKCFYHNGKYYAVLHENIQVPTVDNDQTPMEISRVELICPLIAITRQDTYNDARKYFQELGYDVNPNPEPYHNNLQLGYRTYEINGIVTTTYYYSSTNRKENDIHETKGPYNDEIRIRLELLLRNGYFFTQRMRNITRGYPDFIPSEPPINRQLSEDPAELITQLDNLIRGSKITLN